mgnify:FL=1|tara:strand:+ start:355 stop:1851 length:1497 start_codon:yes stop_codon:yes gene_type:complete
MVALNSALNSALDNALAKAIEALALQLHRQSVNPNPRYPCRIQQRLKLTTELDPELAPELAPEVDLSGWLAAQSAFPKFFWRSRDRRTQIATLGIAVDYQDQQAHSQLSANIAIEQGLRYYWLSGFDIPTVCGKPAGHDKGYPQQRLFLPQLELSQEDARLTLSVVLATSTDIAGRATQLQHLHPCLTLIPAPIKITRRQESLEYPQWKKAIGDAKRCFNQGTLQKVVLARQSHFDCLEPIDFWSLFKSWQSGSLNSYQMGYQMSAEQGFLSFSPERLYRRDGSTLTTEAIAGTLPCSTDTDLARQQAQTLLADSKSRHEHDLVVVEIGAKLEGLGINLSQGCHTELLKLAGIQHLKQRIQGQLPHPQMDAQLLLTLHPTAAVGGLPTEAARNFIRLHEPSQRGLYAGCCGYIGPEQSELAVTIRSAEVRLSQLTLYAGAGIVPQSDPELEWQELEQKIAQPLACLRYPQSRPINNLNLEPTYQGVETVYVFNSSQLD